MWASFCSLQLPCSICLVFVRLSCGCCAVLLQLPCSNSVVFVRVSSGCHPVHLQLPFRNFSVLKGAWTVG